jgi:hypothetical protein
LAAHPALKSIAEFRRDNARLGGGVGSGSTFPLWRPADVSPMKHLNRTRTNIIDLRHIYQSLQAFLGTEPRS